MRIAGRVTTHQPAQMYLFKDRIYPDMETECCLSKSEKKVLHFLVKFGKYVQICNMHSRCKIKIGSNLLQDWSVWFSWIKHGLSVLVWFGSARSGQFCQYYGGCHNTIICIYTGTPRYLNPNLLQKKTVDPLGLHIEELRFI